MTLGTSGGGFDEIVAAILLDGASGVSIGGAAPKTSLGFRLRWRLAYHRAFAEREPAFKFVYSADHDVDRRAAMAMQGAFGGKLRRLLVWLNTTLSRRFSRAASSPNFWMKF